MLAFAKQLSRVEHHLARLLIPHHHNDHHPFLIRHNSLFFLAALILASQLFFNLQVGAVKVLAFATSIFQSEIINLTNQERTKNGSSSLGENSLLNQAAANKAAHMFSNNYWAHYAPDGTSPWYFLNQSGYKYVWAGENLAKDFQTSAGVVQGWMNSPSHRSNLLNKSYKDIGVAVANGTLQGEETTLVVQLFGTKTVAGVGSSLPTPPTQPAGKPSSVSDSLVLESTRTKTQATSAAVGNTKVSSEFSGGWGFLARIKDLNWAARFELLLLAVLFVVFAVDSVIIARKKIDRGNSHSLVHAIVVVIILVGVLIESGGKLI